MAVDPALATARVNRVPLVVLVGQETLAARPDPLLREVVVEPDPTFAP